MQKDEFKDTKKLNKIKRGRGSVGRAIRRHKRKEEDPRWYNKKVECTKISALKKKERINKRCVNCRKLIEPKSTRCSKCAQKNLWKLNKEKSNIKI